MQVVKRDGRRVDFYDTRIRNAMQKACDPNLPLLTLAAMTTAVCDKIGERKSIDVEEIQNLVEITLMEYKQFDAAKKFIEYRQRHSIRRDAGSKLMDTYKEIFFADSENADFKRDNANINTDASMGIMLKLGTEGAKHFVDNYVLPEEFVQADKENFVHYHDKDFSLITLNCCQI